MNYQIEILSRGLDKVITLEEAKRHIRALHDHEDDYIEHLISSSTSLCEAFSNRFLTDASVIFKYQVYSDEMRFFGDIKSIIAASYIDKAGNTIDITGSVQFNNTLNLLYIDQAYSNGSNYLIEAECGVKHLPDYVKHAILMNIGSMFRNRENEIVGKTMAEISLGSCNLLRPFSKRFL